MGVSGVCICRESARVKTFFPGDASKIEIYNARHTEPDEVDSFGYHYYRIDGDEVAEKFVENAIFNDNFKQMINFITGVEYQDFSYFTSKYVSGDYNGWHHDEGNGD